MTGVQTCALPICHLSPNPRLPPRASELTHQATNPIAPLCSSRGSILATTPMRTGYIGPNQSPMKLTATALAIRSGTNQTMNSRARARSVYRYRAWVGPRKEVRGMRRRRPRVKPGGVRAEEEGGGKSVGQRGVKLEWRKRRTAVEAGRNISRVWRPGTDENQVGGHPAAESDGETALESRTREEVAKRSAAAT